VGQVPDKCRRAPRHDRQRSPEACRGRAPFPFPFLSAGFTIPIGVDSRPASEQRTVRHHTRRQVDAVVYIHRTARGRRDGAQRLRAPQQGALPPSLPLVDLVLNALVGQPSQAPVGHPGGLLLCGLLAASATRAAHLPGDQHRGSEGPCVVGTDALDQVAGRPEPALGAELLQSGFQSRAAPRVAAWTSSGSNSRCTSSRRRTPHALQARPDARRLAIGP
jgi:hypothetical protein